MPEEKEVKKPEKETVSKGEVKRPGTSRVSLLITDDQREAVEELAEKEGKTLSDAVIDKVTEQTKNK